MVDARTLTVLTVDDNDAGRYIINHILRREGFNVKEAASGREALRLAASNPDLIILDVNLPDINGLEVCQQIKSDPATAYIPILQMSAIHITSEDKVQGLEHGADGYMVSPISPRELIATVKSLIRMRQAETKLQEKVEELRVAHNQLEQKVDERTAELSKARAEAEMANHIKDEFLATVSHELRTPLTAILGWARLLMSGKLEGLSVRRAIETIERNAKAQAQLIDDLLDISRIITGKLRIEMQPVELLPVIQAAIDSINPTAHSKNIQLRAFLDPAVGITLADQHRLQQIICNLLSNAIKFTVAGGIIEVRLERIDGKAKVMVKDNGKGINADFLPYVFDRFSQADSTTTRRQGGLGLGLSIVRYLVELHNGSVEAFSNGEGQGATFTIYLPLISAAMNQHNLTLADSPHLDDGSLAFISKLNGLKVLIVDDEIDILEMLKQAFNHSGASVRVVSTAVEALEVILQWKPQVIISDVGLPDEDGYSLIGKVRALEINQRKNIFAIALTAYASAEDRVRALAAGFNLHFSKPIDPAELIKIISSLVSIND